MTQANQTISNLKGDNYSVRQAGAKGDGITDDRAAFNRAITSIMAAADKINSDAASVIVPNGTYYIGSYDPSYNPGSSGLSASVICAGDTVGAIATVVPRPAGPGSAYVVGDVVTISGGSATARVAAIGGGGTVAKLTLISGASGYTNAFAVGTTGGSGTGLHVDVSVIRRLSIVGRGATIITDLNYDDSSSLSTIFYVTGNLQVEISGIRFVHKHGPTHGDTAAIYMWGGTGLALRQPQIHDCEVRNFSRGIMAGGYDQLDVRDCRFVLDLGRDSGTLSSNPCVGIWVGADQTTNPANNTRIARCYYNGCMNGAVAGSATQKMSGDGLIYGQSNGWMVNQNVIVNHAFEAVSCQARDQELGPPPETSPSDRRICLITDNTVDDTQPSGTVLGGPGSPDVVAIRVEESETLVADNLVRNAINGIVCDGLDVAIPTTVRNVKISRNKVFMVQGASADCFQGMYFNNTANLEVTDNLILFDGASCASPPWNGNIAGIACGDGNTNPVIKGNIVRDDAPGATTAPICSYYIQQTTGFVMDGNASVGVAVGVYSLNTGPFPTGVLTNHTWTGVATPLGGLFTFIFMPVQTVTFTPGAGATGWYNLLTMTPALGYGYGRINITAPAIDNTFTDVSFDFDAAAYGQDCALVQTRYLSYNGGCINNIRISNNTTGNTQLDVEVSTATVPGPITITLSTTITGILLNQGPTPGVSPLANVFELQCGNGVRTTGGFTAMENAGLGTFSPSHPLHIFRPNNTQTDIRIEQDGVHAWHVGMQPLVNELLFSSNADLSTPLFGLDSTDTEIDFFGALKIVEYIGQTDAPIQLWDQTESTLFFEVSPNGEIHPGGNASGSPLGITNAAVYSGYGDPNTTGNEAYTGSLYLQGDDAGTLWYQGAATLSSTGWLAILSIQDIAAGYGDPPTAANHLSLGAGGSAPHVASLVYGDGSGDLLDFINMAGTPEIFASLRDDGSMLFQGQLEIMGGYSATPIKTTAANTLIIGAGGSSGAHAVAFKWGDGTGNLIDFIGGGAEVASLSDKGEFYAKKWIGINQSTESDSSTSFDLVGDAFLSGNVGIGHAADHTGAYKIDAAGPMKLRNLTASEPVITDANKGLISGQVDLANSAHVKAGSIPSGDFLGWNGSNVVGIAEGVTGTVTEIDSANMASATVVTSINFGASTYVTTTLTYVTGTATAEHSVTGGLVTT